MQCDCRRINKHRRGCRAWEIGPNGFDTAIIPLRQRYSRKLERAIDESIDGNTKTI